MYISYEKAALNLKALFGAVPAEHERLLLIPAEPGEWWMGTQGRFQRAIALEIPPMAASSGATSSC